MIAEPITKLFSIAGINLVFENVTIKGVPRFDIVRLQALQSNYEVEMEDISFDIATVDGINLIVDSQFTVVDQIYRYTFSLDKLPIPDFTGFSKLKVNFVSKELL